MPEVVVAKPREGKFNKNAARRVRVAGKIPAVLYGSGHDPVAIEVDPKQISRILFSETGHNTIFDVEVAGKPAAKAMIVDWQREPINDRLIHIDLKRIALDKALRVSVRVKLLGIPVGVKTAGGILDQVLREVEIECLPADIPSHIDVDVSDLGLHGVVARRRSAPLGQDQVPERRRCYRGARRFDPRRSGCPRPRCEVAAAASWRSAAAEPEVAKKGKTGRRSQDWRDAEAQEARGEEVSLGREASDVRSSSPASRGPFLVVGLGNPGPEYLWTPHNAGFMAIDRIAQQEGVVVQNRRCRAVTATCRIAGREVVLAKPETFMNLSGLAVAALIREFEADPAQRPARHLRRAGSDAGNVQDQGARFAGGPQRSPQRDRRPGQPGVVAAAHWRGTGSAARSHCSGRQASGQGLPALAHAQGGFDGSRRGA